MTVFKNLWYMTRRFKTATVLNLIGLTVAYAACYLFLTQVVYNHSYNKGLTGYEQLYRVETPSILEKTKWAPHISRMIADELATMPQFEHVAMMESWHNIYTLKKGETEFNFNIIGCNNDALNTLAPKLVDGTLTWTDDDQKGVVIPVSVAMRYFGEKQVAGRCVSNGNDSILVRGVFEDFPENSIVKNYIYHNIGNENKNNYNNWNYVCYVRLREQADTTGLSSTVNKALRANGLTQEEWKQNQASFNYKLRLRPLSETWFSGIDSGRDKGDGAVDWILQLSCLLVILIATINFLNFTLAESPMRIKNVNTRRVLGSSLTSLRLGMIAETVLTSLCAFAMASVVIALIAKWQFISELIVGSISINNHLPLFTTIGVVAILVGLMAGSYPAFFVTSFQPALVLKGSFGLTPKGRQLRTLLLCLQFVITFVMIVYIGILSLQSHYIYHSDYGYSKDEVLETSVDDIFNKREALRTELLQQTGIVDVSFSQFFLGSSDGYMGWGRGDSQHEVRFTCMPVDWRYLRTMGIEVVEGRDFNEHDSGVFIINEAARRQWDWVELDKPLVDGELPVVGVCRNVRFNSTRMDNGTAPLAFVIFGGKYKDWDNLGRVNVRVAAGTDKVQIRQKIKDIFMKLGAMHEPEVISLDQQLEYTYQEEFRFIRQVMVFSFICLIITLIGVFCMTMFETEYRRKEIGIRKVMGSSTGEILTMFCHRYVWLLLVSFIVATPLVWYIGKQWLEGFAERTPVYWWLFPLALFTVSLVTLLTVITQSWRTANENPINSVKSE